MAFRARLETVVGDKLKGWAFDPDHPYDPVSVTIHCNGELLGTIVADKHRKDLQSEGFGDGHHGFRFQLPSHLLTGESLTFSVEPSDNSGVASTTRELLTPRTKFQDGSQKPWRAPAPIDPSFISASLDDLEQSLALFDKGDIDGGIGLARPAFRANPNLFSVDTGIVDRVLKHRELKTFERIMADRHRDWYRAPNPSLWQSKLSSKKEMQKFARRNGVRTPTTLARFNHYWEILHLDLPDHYVAKPDGLASAKGVYAMSSGLNVFSGKPVSLRRIAESWKTLTEGKTGISYLVEDFVIDRFAAEGGVIPLDYKIYVFGGVAGFLEVFDRNHPAPSRTPYSVSWQPLPEPLETNSTMGPHLKRPDNLDEIIEIAERLGRDFGAFCRVDLFNGIDGPVLGEITVLPANGKNRTPYANLITQQAYIVFEDERLWSASARSSPA